MSWPVVVTVHALEQATDRAGVTDPTTIVEQVAAARRANGRGGLYVWPQEGGPVFVLMATDDRFIVVTTLASEEAAA